VPEIIALGTAPTFTYGGERVALEKGYRYQLHGPDVAAAHVAAVAALVWESHPGLSSEELKSKLIDLYELSAPELGILRLPPPPTGD